MATSIALDGQGSQTLRGMMDESLYNVDEMGEDGRPGCSVAYDVASISWAETKKRERELFQFGVLKSMPHHVPHGPDGRARLIPKQGPIPKHPAIEHRPATLQPVHVPLPSRMRSDARPIWEPPILNYRLQVGEEYEKQREALLKYYGGDVAKTTEYLDKNVEDLLLLQYVDWVDTQKIDDPDSQLDGMGCDIFWKGLAENIRVDELEVLGEWQKLGITLCREGDGSWFVHTHGVPGRPKTEAEANAFKSLPGSQTQLPRYGTPDDAKDGEDCPSDWTPRLPRLQRVSCVRCRKRKVRCSGPRGPGTTERGCTNCVSMGVDGCNFNKLRSSVGQRDQDPEIEPALITFNQSAASSTCDPTEHHLDQRSTVMPRMPTMEYQPQNPPDEETPLISRPNNQDIQAPSLLFKIVFCGWQCS